MKYCDLNIQPAVNIVNLIDNAKCYEYIRKFRWPDGDIQCIHCKSGNIRKHGHHNSDPGRQRYFCRDCSCYFDDLSDTVSEGRHQPLRMWVLCLYFMGLNLSNCQIAKESGLNESDVQNMTSRLRENITDKKPETVLKGEVESDEVYIVAGHKGNPDAVRKKGRNGRRNRLKGAGGRGTLEKEKPPVSGLTERGGDVAITMPENVRQTVIEPVICGTVEKGTLIYTDEYDIYNRLQEWGYERKSVCHSRGEFARDEDGDGFCEVHVNTIEGFWSLLRSWLRPHRGISQEKLPIYLGFFEFVHNMKKRGKTLLGSLPGLLLI